MKLHRKLDYKTCELTDIEDALRMFIAKEVDSIYISNIYPEAFCDHFKVELEGTGWWDLDWWGTFEFEETQIHVYGCMWHGYIIIDRDSNEE